MLHNDAGQPLYIFDRSRLEDAGSCPRRYFWGYAFLGLGIRELRAMPIWPLLTGSYTHEGIEMVMKGADARTAALAAVELYRGQVDPLLDSLDLGDRRELVMKEWAQQLDLVAALVYGWGLIGWPRYYMQYEAVDIEKEEEIGFLLTSGSEAVELRLLARADIIGRLKTSFTLSDTYVIHNLKTVSDPSKQWQQQWRYDQQTLTERLATENRLGKEIAGVVIEGLCKGRRDEYPKGSGFYQQNSPLIWAWADKVDGTALPGEARNFYGRYEWMCSEPHVFSNGRKCQGGKNHRLSGVVKARVQAEYPGGIFAWIDWLNANDHGLLEQQFISLPPIGRSEFEVERWKRQTLSAELRRQKEAASVNDCFLKGELDEGYTLLDWYFPMTTGHGNCIRPSECPYLKICWEASNPFDDAIWGPRVPNHPAEAELIQIAMGADESAQVK